MTNVPNTKRFAFRFHAHETTDQDGLRLAPVAGTLRTAIRIAKRYNVRVGLRDVAGFDRGSVARGGANWELR